MKFIHNRTALLGLLLLIAGTALFAMAVQEEASPREAVVITDMRGRSVSVPGEIDSIIALGAGSLRLISYLDAVEMVVAVEDQGHGREKTVHDFFHLATYRLAHPGLRERPSIGSAENHEGIITAAPDLVISSTVDVGQLDQLQAVLGIPVFAIDADVELMEREAFFHQLMSLGTVLGREKRAAELTMGIEKILADLEARAELVREPKRAYAGGMMFYGPADLLRTTGDYLPFDLTGTRNVMPTSPAGNRQPYMTSMEDLIAASPDYAFIDAANINLARSGFMTNRQVLEEQVPAFANREVYTNFVYKYYGTNWENQLINVYHAGKVLYPQLFEDISVKEKAEEIWSLFFGLPLDYQTVTSLQKAGPGRVDWFKGE
jgi:iron complex transport system substrate-binding protein